MANIFDSIGDWFDTGSSTDYTKQALLLNALNANKAQEDIESVDTKTDDVRTLANKARETAGQAAGDKAAIAKKQAKAASAMQGGSKLLNAINASSAAANAATEGYDEAQNRAMNLEASRQQSDVANRLNKATNKANARMNATNNQIQLMAGMDATKNAAKQKDWDRLAKAGEQAGSIIAAAYSDADTKDFFKRRGNKMESKALNKMNVKDRYKAKQEAAEEAYYKGMGAPKTTFVDTGNGVTEVQTNSDNNGPVNAPSAATKETKRTTLQNYKPIEQANEAQKVEPDKTEVTEEVAPAANDTTTPETTETPETPETPDIKVDVPEVDEEMMAESGINPQNTPEQNKKGTENALSEITGRRNKDGTYVPLNKVQYADGIQKFGIFATIASIGLAVLTKGAFPPVDFSAMTGLNESYAKYVEGIDNYNKYVRQAQGENSYESERAKGSLDDANKAAKLNLTTENQQRERDTNYQAFLKNLDAQNTQAQTKLEAELNVALQDVLTEGQIQVINANRDVQKEILQLMYTQDVNKLADQGKAIIDAGFSLDDLNKLAQFSKSQSGQTIFENIIKGFNTAANAVNVGANVVNSIKGTGSDCGTKEFFKRIIKF